MNFAYVLLKYCYLDWTSDFGILETDVSFKQ